jgi:hypothetical protein
VGGREEDGEEVIALALLALAAGAGETVYTNEEQVYFAGEAGEPKPEWLGVAVDAGGRMRRVDAYGSPVDMPLPGPLAIVGDVRVVKLDTPAGAIELRRARPFTCWVSTKRPTGEGWFFKPGVRLHDQGGRARVTSDDTAPVEATIRMRNVVWPSGPNRPSLVLYVHQNDPDRAVSYSWADPGAKRIGINLRWMQASCSLDGAE